MVSACEGCKEPTERKEAPTELGHLCRDCLWEAVGTETLRWAS